MLELLDAELGRAAAIAGDVAVFYRMLRAMGIFGPGAPATWREIRSTGQRTPEELIGRYCLECRPVRDLLVEYLRERQPVLDYGSMTSLACDLGMRFWQDLERHNPGISSLNLSRRGRRCVEATPARQAEDGHRPDGSKAQVQVPRLNYRDCLIPVRAFYLDLAQWAADDPARWGPWVVPCPVREEESGRRKERRAPQVAHGRAHPRAPARPAGPGPGRRPAARVSPGTARGGPPGAGHGESFHRGRAGTDPRRPPARRAWAGYGPPTP